MTEGLATSADAPRRARALRRAARLTKFAIVGGSGVAVNWAVFALAYAALGDAPIEEGARFSAANAIGIVVSIFTNFLLNDRWTWGDRSKGGRRAFTARLARYYVTCSIAAAFQVGVAHVAKTWIFEPLTWSAFGQELAPHLALLTGIIAGVGVNLPVSHYWAFREKNTPASAPPA